MTKHLSEVELVRFLEGDLSTKRVRQIEIMVDNHPSLAVEVALIRDALAMQNKLRDAVQDAPGIETERKIRNSLVESITGAIGKVRNEQKTR